PVRRCGTLAASGTAWPGTPRRISGRPRSARAGLSELVPGAAESLPMPARNTRDAWLYGGAHGVVRQDTLDTHIGQLSEVMAGSPGLADGWLASVAEHKRRTRARILDAAADLVAAQGASGLVMTALARRSGG